MRMSDFVGHAPKPSHVRRNQVPYDLERDWSDSVPESPMMRGTCMFVGVVNGHVTTYLIVGAICIVVHVCILTWHILILFNTEINPLSLVPKPYRQVEIKYSKLGEEIHHSL